MGVCPGVWCWRGAGLAGGDNPADALSPGRKRLQLARQCLWLSRGKQR